MSESLSTSLSSSGNVFANKSNMNEESWDEENGNEVTRNPIRELIEENRSIESIPLDNSNISLVLTSYDENSLKILSSAEEFAKFHVEREVQPMHIFISLLKMETCIQRFFTGTCDDSSESSRWFFSKIEIFRKKPSLEERRRTEQKYPDTQSRQIEFSESSKKVFVGAFKEALRIEQPFVRPLELLNALFFPENGIIDEDIRCSLEKMNVNISNFQNYISNLNRLSRTNHAIISPFMNIPEDASLNVTMVSSPETNTTSFSNSDSVHHDTIGNSEHSERLLDLEYHHRYIRTRRIIPPFVSMYEEVCENLENNSSQCLSEPIIITNLNEGNLDELSSDDQSIANTSLPDHDNVSSDSECENHNTRLPEVSTNLLLGRYIRDDTFSWITTYITNLTYQTTLEEELFFGRSEEIDKMIETFTHGRKCNPLLVGDSGVGKTTIAHRLIFLISINKVPNILMYVEVCSVDFARIVVESESTQDFIKRVEMVLHNLSRDKKCILFIDDAHRVLDMGMSQWGICVGTILEKFLVEKLVQCIATSTFEGYFQKIASKYNIRRRFNPIIVDAFSPMDTYQLMKQYARVHEKKEKLFFTLDAINTASALADIYNPMKMLPGRAIDILEQARKSEEIDVIKRQAINNDLRNMFRYVEENYPELNKQKMVQEAMTNFITAGMIHIVVGEHGNSDIITGIQLEVGHEENEEREIIKNVYSRLKKLIIGQSHGLKLLCNYFFDCIKNIRNVEKPLGSILLCGPEGVGKTLTVYKWCKQLFKENILITVNMNQYKGENAVSELFGSRFVDSTRKQNGVLLKKLKKKPFSILLFEEIEQAHTDVLRNLGSILENGFLTDARGIEISFQNTFIFITTNIESNLFHEYFRGNMQNEVGLEMFLVREESESDLTVDEEDTREISSIKQRKVKDWYNNLTPICDRHIRDHFKEIGNHVGQIILFRRILGKDIKPILLNLLSHLEKRIKKTKQINLRVDYSVITYLTDPKNVQYNLHCGVRSIKAVFNKLIRNKVEEFLSNNTYTQTDTLVVFTNDFNKLGMTIQNN